MPSHVRLERVVHDTEPAARPGAAVAYTRLVLSMTSAARWRRQYSSTLTVPIRLCSTSWRLRGVAVDAGQHAGVRRRVDDDVDGGQRLEVGRQADVGVMERRRRARAGRRGSARCRDGTKLSRPTSVCVPCSTQLANQRGPDEPAGAGDENLHETSLCCQASTICAIVCSRLTVMSQPG